MFLELCTLDSSKATHYRVIKIPGDIVYDSLYKLNMYIDFFGEKVFLLSVTLITFQKIYIKKTQFRF